MNIEEIISKLSKIVYDMQHIECVKNNNGNCDIECELIGSDGECIYFKIRDILNDLIRYRGGNL